MEIKTALFINKEWRNGRYTMEYKFIHVAETYANTFASSTLDAKDYTPKKGDKLFFLPGCTIPRFKMKKFCKEYGTAMVKYKTSATALFIGPDTIKELVTSAPPRRKSKIDVATYFRRYGNADFAQSILDTTSDFVYLNSSNVDSDLKNAFHQNPGWGHWPWSGNVHTMFKSEQDKETYDLILSSENIYNQADIARKLNTGSVMSEEQYESIQRLFVSEDKSNAKVAIEIMSNCDFEKSAVYLLLLIHNHGVAIDDCPTSSHVNFKSLLKFFNIDNTRNKSISDVIEILLENKLLSRNNLEMIMPLAKEVLEKRSGIKYFVPVKWEYSEEIEQGLQENILESTHNTEIVTDTAETLNPHI